MFQIGETLVGRDIIDKCFICDLQACKGACCVEGDAGAPVLDIEEEEINKAVSVVWHDLSEKAKKVIEENGPLYRDADDELVTSIVDGKDCVFTYYDENGICKCAIEKAYNEGKTDFYKPISCHLYPIRLQKYHGSIALNYHKWQICKDAVILGNKEGVRIYQFLQAALIRAFGQEWYDELCLVANEYQKQQDSEKR